MLLTMVQNIDICSLLLFLVLNRLADFIYTGNHTLFIILLSQSLLC